MLVLNCDPMVYMFSYKYSFVNVDYLQLYNAV